MIIANPLYDVVFKYLLDDTDIAQELLATILGEDIVHIEVKPQETTTETSISNINIMRLDFKAVIKLPSGELKKVLIELQKAKQVFDVMRFRRYLAENYRREDDILTDGGTSEKQPLPIITIYILGFPLDNIKNAVVKINREYRDAITNELLEVKENFVELLTHDCYLIQVLRLKAQTRTKLERVLQIFSPEFRTKDLHQLDFKGNADDPFVRKMVDRLGRAIASDEMRDIMDVEDEVDRLFNQAIQKVEAAKDKIIADKDRELKAERKKAETERKKAETERKKAETERLKNEELRRQIAELQKRIKK